MKIKNKKPIKISPSNADKLKNSKNFNAKTKNVKKQNSFLAFIKKNIWIILILILTLIIYLNAIKNDFVFWDDDTYILNNPFIKSLSFANLRNIFSEPYFSNYHPITTLSYAVEYSLFKLNPHPYHLLNILLHLINTLLVFLLIKSITKEKEVSLITALLFAIHPMHVESVAWISERKDVLYAMFFLSSLIFYLKYIKERVKIKFLIVSFVLCLCSLMSKSAAVSLPLIMLLLSYFINKKIILKDWLFSIPFFVLSLIFGIIALQTQKGSIEITNINEIYNSYERVLLICFSLFFYIIRFILPYGFSALHPYPNTLNISLPMTYYFAPIFLILLIIVIFISKKELRGILIFGFLFFLSTIFLVIQIMPLGHAVVSERYTYLPYIGLSFIIANIINALWNRKFKITIFSIAAPYLIFLSISTLKQNTTWKNSEMLWTKAIDVYPDNFIAYNNRGSYKNKQGNIKGAIEDHDKAIKINPKDFDAFYNRGIDRAKLSDFKGAVEDYNNAILLNTKNAKAYNNRGNAYKELRDFNAALVDYSKAIELNSKYSEAYYNRGNVNTEKNLLMNAVEDFNNAIMYNSNYYEAYNSRGIAKGKLNDLKGAVEDYSKAINLNPEYVDAYNNRGYTLGLSGKTDEAIADLKTAIKLNPNFYLAYENIAFLYFKKNDYNQSFQYYKKIVEIAPLNAQAYYNLGNARYYINDLDGACTDWHTSLKLGYESAIQMIETHCK